MTKTSNDVDASELSDIGSYNCPSNREHSHLSKKSEKIEEHYIEADTLMIMRHSERVDDCCPGWIEKCNINGKYEPFDLNMPTRLPIQRPLRDFLRDTCLTRSGLVLAQMVGRSLAMTDNIPGVIYCSPSLRCIQTATLVREMSGSKALLRVEPGLFENFQYPNGVPTFLTPIQRHIFPVDKTFRPFVPLDTLIRHQETNEEYNDRIRTTLKEIYDQPEVVVGKKQLKILIVAHASTVDMATGLTRERPRSTNCVELENIAIPVPYCSMTYLKKKKSLWIPQPHAVPPITYEHLTTKYNPHFVHRP